MKIQGYSETVENAPLLGIPVQRMEHDLINGEVVCANKGKQTIKKAFESLEKK
jgi:hypothetical protein